MFSFEVQRRHVIETQGQSGGSDTVRETQLRDPGPVVAGVDPSQRGSERVAVDRVNAEFGEHTHTVTGRCRLDQACQNELEERLVLQGMSESESLVDAGERVDEQPRAAGLRDWVSRQVRRLGIQREHSLIRVELLMTDCHQCGQLCFRVRRSQVLQDSVGATGLVRDLHSRRSRRGLHLA